MFEVRFKLNPRFVDLVANITEADFNALTQEHLNLDDMIMVVICDKAKVYDEVAALGLNMVEIDADGNPK